jgi:hypothetical protein
MKMSNKVYDGLKWIVTVVLPAIAALYTALSGIWGFPYGEQIVGTIVAVETFLGVVLQVSNAKYKKTSA